MAVRDEISRSVQLIQTGDYDGAIDLLRYILADEPDNLPALLNIAIAYTESGKNTEAIQTIEYYLKHDQENDEAYEAIGCAYLRSGLFESAEKHLRKSLELNPENASVRRNLSVLLSQTGRGRESMKELKQSYELNPTDYLTMYALGLMYQSVRDTEAAREMFQKLTDAPNVPLEIRRQGEKRFLELTIGW